MSSEDYHPHDVIRLVGLGGVGRHGVLPEERRDGQTFLADVTLHVDTRAAAASDDLADTVDYSALAQQVVAVIEGEPVNLIETLAGRIADVALGYGPVRSVEVTVHKPEAPVGVPFSDVELTIQRGAPTGAAMSHEHSMAGAEAGPALGMMAAAASAHNAAAPAVAPAAGAPAVAAPAVVAPVIAPAAAAAAPEPASADAGSSFDGVPAMAADEAQEPGGAVLQRTPDSPADVVLSIGGNVGDVRATLRSAVADLREVPGLIVETVSPLARTAAVVLPDAVPQPDFLNAVVLASTTLSPLDLLARVHEIEDAYGRQRRERWGERTLDIDIVSYDGVSSSEPELTLPHPLANERAFVLVPWAQADPTAFLPGLGGGPVAVLAETAPDRSGVRWLALDWLDQTAGSRSQGAAAMASAESVSAESAEPASGEAAPAEPVVAEPVAAAPELPGSDASEPSMPESAEQAQGSGAGAAIDYADFPAQFDESAYQPQESVDDLELLAHGDEPEPESADPESAEGAASLFGPPAMQEPYDLPAPEAPSYAQPAPELSAYEPPAPLAFEPPSYAQPAPEQPAFGQPGPEQPAYGQPVAAPPAYARSAYEPPAPPVQPQQPEEPPSYQPPAPSFEPPAPSYEPPAPVPPVQPPAQPPSGFEPPATPEPPAPQSGFGAAGPVSFPPVRTPANAEPGDPARPSTGLPWTGPDGEPEPGAESAPQTPPKWQPLRRDQN